MGISVSAQLAPEETIKTLQVAEGLQASVFAAEPMLMKPADIDVDAMGRVWVCEGVNYRQWSNLRKEGDRIVILEDTKGTGKADKQTVFYQGTELACPLGICVLGNKVIVSDAPNVWLYTDDGTGHAAKKELLFTGIKGVQHDHAVHTFVFGPDGKLYFNMGNAGEELHRPDGSRIQDVFGNTILIGKPGTKAGTTDKVAYRQGLVLRMNVDGSELEVLANNFRNNYEVCIDSFGTLWQSDNDDDGNKGVRINYVMEYGNFGYTDEITGAGWSAKRTNLEKDIPSRHWHQNDQGVIPNLLQTGQGSPTGIIVYEGKLLPEVFRNQIIHCDPGPNVVRSYPVQPSGAGYSARIVNVLQGTSDHWFRPSDVCVAPDGSLIVSDWYDPGVGGHQMGDHKYPEMHGRIYRVAPPGAAYKIPPLDLNSAEGAAEALASPNMSRRYLAWTTLHDMGAKAEPALLKLWNGPDARLKARALYLLARIEGKGGGYIAEAMRDKNPDIRITALRCARGLKMDVIPLVAELISDESPQVRRECAIALHYNKSPDLPMLWAELADRHDGKDRWYLEALGIGAADREAECFAAWLKKAGDNWNTTPGRDIIWRSRAPLAATYLGKIILDPVTSDEERPRFIRSLDFIPDGVEKTAALTAMLNSKLPDVNVPMEALSRLNGSPVARSSEVAALVNRILDAKKGTQEFVDLCEQLNAKDRDGELLAIAAAHSGDSTGAAAIRLVVKNQNHAELSKALAGPDAANITAALGNLQDGSGAKMLEGILMDAKQPFPVRQAAVKALARTNRGARALLAFAKKKGLPDDMLFTAGNELRSSPGKEIRDEAAALFPAPAGKDNKPLPPIAQLLKMNGDAKSGHAVFAATCIRCHQVNGEGVDFGPNLTEIGTKLGKDALMTKVLQPGSSLAFGYEGKTLKLKSGDQADGLITSQTEDEVTLKTSSGTAAIVTKYKRSDIAEIKTMKVTMMPEGLQTAMSTQEFVDLIEYMAALKKK
jgi:putative membrane-bound dehydrogenase-like protein